MKSLGRIAAVCCWVTLAACGPEVPAQDGTATTGGQNIEVAPPICPLVMPPECDGDLYPIYEGDCLIGFECVNGDGVISAGKPAPGPLCPQVMPPQCDGDLYPIYRADGCLIGFECVTGVTAGATCPQPVPPGPGYCEDGTITPVYDANKCIVRYACTL